MPAYASEMAKYPWIYPPIGFIPLNRSGKVVVPNGSTQGTIIPLEVIQLPQGYKGWIRRMGLESGNWDQIAFQFLVGGASLRDFTLLRVPIGSPSTPEDVYIEITPNVTTQLQAIVTAATTDIQPLRWYLGGWYYQEN